MVFKFPANIQSLIISKNAKSIITNFDNQNSENTQLTCRGEEMFLRFTRKFAGKGFPRNGDSIENILRCMSP